MVIGILYVSRCIKNDYVKSIKIMHPACANFDFDLHFFFSFPHLFSAEGLHTNSIVNGQCQRTIRRAQCGHRRWEKKTCIYCFAIF